MDSKEQIDESYDLDEESKSKIDSHRLHTPKRQQMETQKLNEGNSIMKLIRKITSSPSKFKKAPLQKSKIKMSYTKSYNDFAPPENNDKIPKYQ